MCQGLAIKCFSLPKSLIPWQTKVLQVESIRVTDASASSLFKNLTLLLSLDLSKTSISEIGYSYFKFMSNLMFLKLNDNNIKSIESWTFTGLHHLRKLTLNGNKINIVKSKAFADMNRMKYLSLNELSIRILEKFSFHRMIKLQELDLSDNKLEHLTEFVFSGLQQLLLLHLKGNPLHKIHKNTFAHLQSMRYISSGKAEICCFATQVDVCLPQIKRKDLLCSDLIKGTFVKASFCCVSLYILTTNVIALIYNSRLIHTSKHALLAVSSSGADVVIGTYFGFIFVVDIMHKEEYPMFRQHFLSSTACKVLSIAFFVGVEVSILTLLVTAVNHYIAIGGALKKQNIKKKTNCFILLAVWISTISIATLIVTLGTTNSTTFCFIWGANLENEILNIIASILNIFLIIVVMVLYKISVNVVKKSDISLSKTKDKKTKTFITKVVIVMVVNVFSLAAYTSLSLMTVFNAASEFYTWILVFGVPANACLNPIVHTYYTREFLSHFIKRK